MKAAQIVAYRQPLEIGTHPDPTPAPTEALVKVEANGVCRTDWHFWNGDWAWVNFQAHLPFIPGHEFAGTVVEVGSAVTKVKVGDRVTVPFHEGCGACHYCISGSSQLCPTPNFPGWAHSGGYGELVAVAGADFNCVPLPETVDFVAAASLGCRYMSAWHATTHLGGVRPGQAVVVLGAGGMGLAAVQIATQAGAQVIAVDRRDEALDMASKEGAVAVVNSTTTENVGAAVQELTGGGAHLAIDCIGGQETTLNGLLSLRRAGRLVAAGLTTQDVAGMVTVPIDMMLALELTLVGSFGNPRSGYADLLGLVGRGELNPGSLVTQQIGIDQINDTMQALDRFETVGCHVVTSY
jgi:propanol-preferring alcohol dehydrogenase